MSKTVYLDSSDFSDLSAPLDQMSDEDRRVIACLRHDLDHNGNTYLLSAVHLSEATHATTAESHKQAAIRRAALIEELCGRNSVRMPNDLFNKEIKRAIAGASNAKLPMDELLSAKSEWFGMNVVRDLSLKKRQLMNELEQRLSHLPRRERRKLKSQMNLSKASGRQHIRELFRAAPPFSTSEFPFGLIDPAIVQDWFLGDKSDEEFHQAIVDLTNQPKAMVEHLLDVTNERLTIYSLLRNEGRDMHSRMDLRLRDVMERIDNLIDLNPAFPVASAFRRMLPRAEFYRAVIDGYGDVPADVLTDKEATRIVNACPAVSTFVNAYMAYICSLFDANVQRRKLGRTSIVAGKASDFSDLMHAAYAPYCDIFRCDTRFGAILKQDAGIRNKVVDRRAGLLKLTSYIAA